MKRNRDGAGDFEPSEENDASDHERQPEWSSGAASPFERPPRRDARGAGAHTRRTHSEAGEHDRYSGRQDGRGFRPAAHGHDSGRGGYSSREESRLMPIDADVLAYFPDPGAVNQALRALIPIIDARGARGAHGARGGFARRTSSYGGHEKGERREGAYRHTHTEARGTRERSERSFPSDRPPFARKRPRGI
ncbi:MAG: hypothetical protein LBC99_09510 [Spirochaetota bacterium]|nr:hypothetical protein [Spirochaetota bacterium]